MSENSEHKQISMAPEAKQRLTEMKEQMGHGSYNSTIIALMDYYETTQKMMVTED